MLLTQSNVCPYMCTVVLIYWKQQTIQKWLHRGNICHECWEQIWLDNSTSAAMLAFLSASRAAEVSTLIPCKTLTDSLKYPLYLSHAVLSVLFNKPRAKLFGRDTNTGTDKQQNIARRIVRYTEQNSGRQASNARVAEMQPGFGDGPWRLELRSSCLHITCSCSLNHLPALYYILLSITQICLALNT